MDEISNEDLKRSDIPDASDFQGVLAFANTYDGYERFGGPIKCGDFANPWADKYYQKKQLPEDLADLRTCLFFESRRLRFVSMDGAHLDEFKGYLAAIVEKIRGIVAAAEK